MGHDLTTIIALAQGFADSVEVKELQEVLKDINQAARDGLADTRQAVRTLVREHEALPQESNDDGHGDEHGQALGDRKPAIHVHQGVGLKQIGEQCRLMGGSLSSGPRKNGGWTVEAILPGTGKRGATLMIDLMLVDDLVLLRKGLVRMIYGSSDKLPMVREQ